MLLLVTAMGFGASAFGRAFRLYTIVTLAVVFALEVWAGLDGPRIEAGLPTPGLRVRERVFWYACHLWFLVLALRLLRARAGLRESR